MTEILYPPHFHQKVMAQEAPGGEPSTVSLVLPTITQLGKPFKLKLAVLDEHGYPSMQFDGVLTIREPSSSPASIEVPFTRGQPAVGSLHNQVINSEGLFRFETELNGQVFHSNPTFCTNVPKYHIYWGDPHVHTILSNCHADIARSLNFCYTAARYLIGLDWVSATDHVSNGRCDFSKWKEQCTVCNVYDEPTEFVTLPGYEASLKGGAGGDNNVYFSRQPDMFVDEYDEGTVNTICEKLSKKKSHTDFFVVPHHTTRPGKHGEIGDDIYPGEDLMPVIEIHSKWGTSEYRGNPNPLKKIHPGPSYAVDMLNRGLKFGFIAGTDSHATMPSGRGMEPGHIDRLPGLTAVRTQELTRDAIYQGVRRRNCYATSLERIYLNITVAGVRPGESLDWLSPQKPRAIQITAAAQSNITNIEIIRNGTTIHKHPIEHWKETFTYIDEDDLNNVCLNSKYLGNFVYYYIRVTCSSGAQAWSSPVWLLLK